MIAANNLIYPECDLPANVLACMTTRRGGYSLGPYASLNLALHVGDDARHVAANRHLIQQHLQMPAYYLEQTHTNICLDLDQQTLLNEHSIPVADAAVTSKSGLACCVMVADCLPVIFTSSDGAVVAAAHAGWRGLANGVLENTLLVMRQKQQHMQSNAEISAWLGPCIGARSFEVGAEVKAAFCQACWPDDLAATMACFKPAQRAQHYLADLAQLARLRLQRRLVNKIYGNDSSAKWCTYLQQKFFSYRREQKTFTATGRMAAYIGKLTHLT